MHFAKGEFDPASQSGRRVIGHEMAHLAQQSRRRVPTTRLLGAVPINDDPTLEGEADRLGARAASAMSRGSGARLGEAESAGATGEEGSTPVGAKGPSSATDAGAGNGAGVAQPMFRRYFTPGPHNYRLWHRVMREGQGSEAAVGQYLTEHPAPRGRPATTEGTRNSVPVVGSVDSYSEEGGRAIRNQTVEGEHLLHPGRVRRRVETRDGWTGITTEGDGTGAFPRANEALANPLWGGMAAKARWHLWAKQKWPGWF